MWPDGCVGRNCGRTDVVCVGTRDTARGDARGARAQMWPDTRMRAVAAREAARDDYAFNTVAATI
eukprot:1088022-Prymnesium_polylepis.1